jgi:hypothetical protein
MADTALGAPAEAGEAAFEIAARLAFGIAGLQLMKEE